MMAPHLSSHNRPPTTHGRLILAIFCSLLLHSLLLIAPITQTRIIDPNETVFTVHLIKEVETAVVALPAPTPLPDPPAPPTPPKKIEKTKPYNKPAEKPSARTASPPSVANLLGIAPPAKVCRSQTPIKLTPEQQQWIEQVQEPYVAAYFSYMRPLMDKKTEQLRAHHPAIGEAKCSAQLHYVRADLPPHTVIECSDSAWQTPLAEMLAQQNLPRPDGYPMFMQAIQMDFYFLGQNARADVMQKFLPPPPQTENCE